MKKRILVLMALTAALLLVAGPVAAKATKTPYTADYFFYPPTDPGTWTNPDGNVHVRGLVHINRIENATDLRVEGWDTIVVNANWDANMVGPMWGTFTVEPDIGGGLWEGTWTGMVHADGTVSVRVVGHGTGGFEGLKVFTFVESPALGAQGSITGYILDPHG